MSRPCSLSLYLLLLDMCFTGTNKYAELWDAAKAIVDRCVKGAPASRNAGGATGDLGTCEISSICLPEF